MSLDQLTRAVIALPEDQRRSLFHALRDTLPPEEYLDDDDVDYDAPGAPRAYSDEEIHAIAVQRLEEIDSGKVVPLDGEEVMRELMERYSK